MKRVPDPDYEILLSDPHQLLVKYQELIRSCVWDFVGKGVFRSNQIHDVVQNVNEELLRRIPGLQAGYNGSFLVRTYVAAAVRNICLRIREQQNKAVPLRLLEEDELPSSPESEKDRYSIDQAKRLLHAIILQYGRKRPKLIISLKLWCRLPLTEQEVLDWYQDCPEPTLQQVLGLFGDGYAGRSDWEVFQLATGFFNLAAEKENAQDALRKWTIEKVNEIIELLNGDPPMRTFDKDSLQILLHEYFSPFLNEE